MAKPKKAPPKFKSSAAVEYRAKRNAKAQRDAKTFRRAKKVKSVQGLIELRALLKDLDTDG
jgi:hypothetical protein